MASIPSAPTGLVVTNTATLGTVRLSWINPSQIGIPAISDYSFSCSPSSGVTFSTIIDVAYTRINAIGLVTGNTYLFSVSVVNSAGTSLPAYSKAFIYLSAPVAPTSFSATPGPSQVTLSWDQVVASGGLPITGYTITSVPATKTVTVSAGIYSTIITGLTNGTSYVFSITQNNLSASSDPSTVTATPVSAPNAPTNITITSSPVTSGSATISWTDPVLTGGSAITGYTITPYPSSGISFSQPFTNPTDIYGLTLNSSYIFIVSAINSIGTSPGAISPVYTYNRIPDAPTGVSVSNIAGNIIVNWDPVVMSEGLPITGFIVISTPSSKVYTVPIGTFSQSITKLIPGVSYTFTVYSKNTLGTSAGTTSSPITISAYPDIATAIKVTNTILNGVALTWTDPVNNGGLPITSYTLASIPSGAIFTGSTLSDNIAVTGLNKGSTYIFSIITNNSFGSSPVAVSAPFSYLSIPDTPTGVSVTPGDSSVIINWMNVLTSGGASILNYIITSISDNTSVTVSAGSSSYTFTGLTNGNAYTFNIVAINSFGPSVAAVTNSVTPTSVPDPPTKIVVSPGNSSVLVQWKSPVMTGGLPITGYIVNLLRPPNPPIIIPLGNVTYAFINDLSNDQSYSATVNAVNSKGQSVDSGESLVVTPLSTFIVPGAPTGLSVTASSGSLTPSILLSFTSPIVTAANKIINYQYSTDGGSTYTQCNPIVTKSPIPITAVSSDGTSPIVNGTTYSILIQAINASGIGTASSSISGTPTASIANAPSISSITPGNTTCSVAFTQSFNGGAAITNLSYSTDGGSTFTVFSPVQTNSPLTISGLANGSTYSIKLKAINSAGTSTASSATSVTLAASEPAAPTALSSSSITTSSFSIGFTPGSTGGSSITNYSFSTNGGTTFLAFSPAQTTSPVAITKQSSGAALVAGATYSVKLKEINAIGSSVASASVSVTLSAGDGLTYDYPVITNATYDSAADTISIYFTPPSGIGEVTNYQYSTDGSEFSVLELYPPQTTSPIVIRYLSSYDSFVGILNYTDQVGISIGIVQDVYLQLIPQTIDTLCKASNTYKITTYPNVQFSPPGLPPNTKGMVMPGAPSYGPIRFNMPTQLLTSNPDYKNPYATLGKSIPDYSLNISNYAYTTDGGATYITLSPAQTDTLTLYTKSDSSSISGTTTIGLYPIDSSGNLGTLSPSIYTFIPNTLSNPPEPPTLLSVNVDYYNDPDMFGSGISINYRSNDPYSIYPVLIYFHTGDSIINLSYPKFVNKESVNNGWMLTPFYSGYGNFSLSYNNGIYTIYYSQRFLPLVNTSFNKLEAVLEKQFKVTLLALNPSSTLITQWTALQTENPLFPFFNNNSTIFSRPSNTITVSYSSFSPQIGLNYSATGITVIIPQTSSFYNYYGNASFNQDTQIAGSGDGYDRGGYLPFNVGSYNNSVMLSLDGGTTFTSTSVTWTLIGPKLPNTFTVGQIYNLVIKILFVDAFGAQCETGNSNSIQFNYGFPTFSFEPKRRRIRMLTNGNVSDTNILGAASGQTLSISLDGGTTFRDISTTIAAYNGQIASFISSPQNSPDFIFNQGMNGITFTQGQTYSVVLKCNHGYGIFTSTPVSCTPPLTGPVASSNYLLAINSIVSKSNIVYLFVDTTIPKVEFSSVISLNISSTIGSLGSSVTADAVFDKSLKASHTNKLNVLQIPMSNFTPGTPSYITIGLKGTRSYTTYGGGLANQYTFTPYLVPNPPTISRISFSSAGHASIEFTPGSVNSTNNEPGGITNYLFSTDYFFTKTECNVDGGTGNIIISLAAGTYSIQIQAVSAAGRSASSNAVSFTMT
uniref:Fibronectin type-III domain-containing protein n=1 Tax=viral metagenome TaxID=1070528 RepID=A0A6C0AMT7_9ZZZZ